MKLILTLILLAGLSLNGKSQCPTAAFNATPSQGCATPHTVFFTDQSTLPDTWLWSFGDGSTSTAQNPIHTYTSTGTFTVSLTVQDTVSGCTDNITTTVKVSSLSADFSSSSTFGCGPLTANFSDNSTVNESSIASWVWNFGDGNISSQQNPTHIYTQPGTYTVSLTVTGNNGCTDVETKSNYIQVIGPDVDFEADVQQGCNALLVDFSDNTVPNAPVTSRSWDFGDGNTSSLQNPSHTYNNPGDFDVSLTVSDLDGCSRTYTLPEYISVLNSSTGTAVVNECNSYTWIDGNTFTSSNNTATHILTNVAGCDSIVTLDLTIASSLNTNVDFVVNSTNDIVLIAEASNVQYQWLDCDQNFQVIPGANNQTYMATQNGNYAVKLTKNGCADTSACVAITTVGIAENDFGSELVAFPNPTEGNVTVDLGASYNSVEVNLTDLSGRLVQSKEFKNTDLLKLNIDAPAGIYLMKIESDKSKAVVRLVKQ